MIIKSKEIAKEYLEHCNFNEPFEVIDIYLEYFPTNKGVNKHNVIVCKIPTLNESIIKHIHVSEIRFKKWYRDKKLKSIGL